MRIEEEFGRTNGHKTLLALSPAADLRTNATDMVDRLVRERRMKCIYISLNRSAYEVMELLKKKNLPKDRVSIIDCITGKVVNTPHEKNVGFVTRPYSLTEISIGIARFAKSMGGDAFVLLDSLDALQMYNRPEVVQQFIHSLMSLPSKYGLKVVVLATVEGTREVLGSFTQYFDRVTQITPVGKREKPERMSV